MEVNDPELPVREDAADAVVREERKRKLREAIDALDSIDHEILILKAAGQSEREIAAAVGFKSKESVRKRMKKFMPMLQEKLKDFYKNR